MSSTGTTPAGWYPDPAGTGLVRWWDGSTWSEATQAHPNATGYGGPAIGGSNSFAPGSFQGGGMELGQDYRHAQQVVGRPQTRSFVQRNPQSCVALGFTALYAVLAFTVGITLLGIIPLLAAFRAVGNKEEIGIPALVISIAVMAFLLLG